LTVKPSRIAANLVGMMLFVQVILGGSSTLLGFPVIYHIVWGVATFAVLLVTMFLAVREYGTKSTLFRVSVVSTLDFVLQGVLGLVALESGDVVVVVHLTNAFLVAVLVTYLVSFADSADKAGLSKMPSTGLVQP
jgi:heme A synthase